MSDKEHSLASLGESEKATVENPPGNAIPPLNQRGQDDTEVSASSAVRTRKQRIDVLKYEPRRPSDLQNSNEFKEKATSLAIQSGALAGDADVLTGKSSRKDVNGGEVGDGSDITVESESVMPKALSVDCSR